MKAAKVKLFKKYHKHLIAKVNSLGLGLIKQIVYHPRKPQPMGCVAMPIRQRKLKEVTTRNIK